MALVAAVACVASEPAYATLPLAVWALSRLAGWAQGTWAPRNSRARHSLALASSRAAWTVLLLYATALVCCTYLLNVPGVRQTPVGGALTRAGLRLVEEGFSWEQLAVGVHLLSMVLVGWAAAAARRAAAPDGHSAGRLGAPLLLDDAAAEIMAGRLAPLHPFVRIAAHSGHIACAIALLGASLVVVSGLGAALAMFAVVSAVAHHRSRSYPRPYVAVFYVTLVWLAALVLYAAAGAPPLARGWRLAGVQARSLTWEAPSAVLGAAVTLALYLRCRRTEREWRGRSGSLLEATPTKAAARAAAAAAVAATSETASEVLVSVSVPVSAEVTPTKGGGGSSSPDEHDPHRLAPAHISAPLWVWHVARPTTTLASVLAMAVVGLSRSNLGNATYAALALGAAVMPMMIDWLVPCALFVAEAHLLLMYVLLLLLVPQRHGPWGADWCNESCQATLDAFGLWDFSVAGAMAPLLGLVALLGARERLNSRAQQRPAAAARAAASWRGKHAARLLATCRRELSGAFGPLALTAVGAVLLAARESYATAAAIVIMATSSLGYAITPTPTLVWAAQTAFASAVGAARFAMAAFPDTIDRWSRHWGISQRALETAGLAPVHIGGGLYGQLWDAIAVVAICLTYRAAASAPSEITAVEVPAKFLPVPRLWLRAVGLLRRATVLHADKVAIAACLVDAVVNQGAVGVLPVALLLVASSARKAELMVPLALFMSTFATGLAMYIAFVAADELNVAPGESRHAMAEWAGVFGAHAGLRTALLPKGLALFASIAGVFAWRWRGSLSPAERESVEDSGEPCSLFVADVEADCDVAGTSAPPEQSALYRQLLAMLTSAGSALEHLLDEHPGVVWLGTLLLSALVTRNAVGVAYLLAVGITVIAPLNGVRRLAPLLALLSGVLLLLQYAVYAGPPPDLYPQGGPWIGGRMGHAWRLWLGVDVDRDEAGHAIGGAGPRLCAHAAVAVVCGLIWRAKRRAGSRSGFLAPSGGYAPLGDEPGDTEGGDAESPWTPLTYSSRHSFTLLDLARLWVFRYATALSVFLVLAIGTAQRDVLHFGYLALALACLQGGDMDDEVIGRRLLRTMRAYNYVVLLALLLWQAPIFPPTSGRCDFAAVLGLRTVNYVFSHGESGVGADLAIFVCLGLRLWLRGRPGAATAAKFVAAERLSAARKAELRQIATETREQWDARDADVERARRRERVGRLVSEYQAKKLAESGADEADHVCPSPATSAFKAAAAGGGAGADTAVTPAAPRTRSRSRLGIEAAGSSSMMLRARARRQANDSGMSSLPESEEPPPVSEQKWTQALAGVVRDVRVTLAEGDAGSAAANASAASAGGRFPARHRRLDSLGGESDADFDDTDEGEITAARSGEGPEAEEGMSQAAAPPKKRRRRRLRAELASLLHVVLRRTVADWHIVCYALLILAFVVDLSLLTLPFPLVVLGYAMVTKRTPREVFFQRLLLYCQLLILAQYAFAVPVSAHCGSPSQYRSHSLQLLGLHSGVASLFVENTAALLLAYLSLLSLRALSQARGTWARMPAFSPFVGDLAHRGSVEADRIVKPRAVARSYSERLSALIPASASERVGGAGGAYVAVVAAVMAEGGTSRPVVPPGAFKPALEERLNALLEAVARKGKLAGDTAPNFEPTWRARVLDTRPWDEGDDTDEQAPPPLKTDGVQGGEATKAQSTALLECLVRIEDVRTGEPARGAAQHCATMLRHVSSAGTSGGGDDDNGGGGGGGGGAATAAVVDAQSIGRGGRDLYMASICADMVVFFYTLFFYSLYDASETDDGGIGASATKGQFPIHWVLVLLMLFALMLAERTAYTMHSMRAKALYHFGTLAIFTCYAVYAAHTDSYSRAGASRHRVAVLQLFFVLKALSMAVSAAQLRHGFPDFTQGQFFFHAVSISRHIGFVLYRALPYLYELRTIHDWACASTTLTLYDWLKLEDIYSSLYMVRCDLELARLKRRVGDKTRMRQKLLQGGLFFAALVLVLWLPLLLFSSANPSLSANPVTDISLELAVVPVPGQGRIALWSGGALRQMADLGSIGDRVLGEVGLGGLSDLSHETLQLACLERTSIGTWSVPKPTLQRLANNLTAESAISTTWTMTRARPTGFTTLSFTDSQPLGAAWHTFNASLFEAGMSTLVARAHAAILRLSPTAGVAAVGTLRANLSLVLEADARDDEQWWEARASSGNASAASAGDVNDALGVDGAANGTAWSDASLWEVARERCEPFVGPWVVLVSDAVVKGAIAEQLSAIGVASLYVTFVLGVGRFVRLFASNLRMRIPYENLPSTRRLWELVEDVYAARAEGQLALEEELFFTLINVYRSPSILYEFSRRPRPKQD